MSPQDWFNHAISSFSVNNLRVVVTQQQSQALQHQALPNGRTGPGGTENDQVKDGPSIIVIGKNVTFTNPILSSSTIIALRMLALFIPKTISKKPNTRFYVCFAHYFHVFGPQL